jgi:hypothetical protein
MDDDLLPYIVSTLIGVCVLALSWFAGTDAPYVPTKLNKISELFKKVGLKKGQVFYELGSGDGRVVLEAAKMGAKSYGVEQSWIRVWISRYKAWRLKLPAIFYHGNIFTLNYYPADIIYIFLLPAGVYKLETKLKQELKPGALVITQTFHFKNWKPIKKIDLTKGEKPISQEGKKPGDFWVYRV